MKKYRQEEETEAMRPTADNRKKVLIITYYWPPGSGPGVQRWLKFSKFLPNFGWNPIILTVKDGTYPSQDRSLSLDIMNEVVVHRARTLEPFGLFNLLRGKPLNYVETAIETEVGNDRLLRRVAKYVRANFFLPDARVGWNTFAVRKAQKIIEQEKPDVIITSGPPHSTHLIGLQLRKKYRIPWVADFRDPWTTSYAYSFLPTSARSHKRNVALENQVLKDATAVITVSPSMREEYAGLNPMVETVYNGYDEEDFTTCLSEEKADFSMAYVGSLKSTQNIEELWEALTELRDDDPVFRERFRLEITGTVSASVRNSIKQTQLEECTYFTGFVAHKEAIGRMCSADLLLLPIPRSSNNRVILTGKLFEYLATGKPILAIGPTDGDAASVLAECHRPSMVDYQDKETIKERIRTAFSEFCNQTASIDQGNGHTAFSRRSTTKQLVGILNRITEK